MQRLFIVALLVASLAACGRSADTQPSKLTVTTTTGCFVVQILGTEKLIDGQEVSLLEVLEEPEPHGRIRRTGVFGAVGDKFRYCE